MLEHIQSYDLANLYEEMRKCFETGSPDNDYAVNDAFRNLIQGYSQQIVEEQVRLANWNQQVEAAQQQALRQEVEQALAEAKQELAKQTNEITTLYTNKLKDMAEQYNQAEEKYKEQIKDMNKVLHEMLEHFGAVALVSTDSEVRESARKLLQERGVNSYFLLKKKGFEDNE